MPDFLLSLCMIVKNEQENLPRCLSSIQDKVDEIILVDTGSTDSTIEIAQRFGAKIFHFSWNDDFSAARNYSLQQAQGDWIIYLDADEELHPDSQPLLRKTVASSHQDALTVLVRNLNPPGSLAPYYDSVQVRIFRNLPAYRFERRIHNQILPSIERHGGKVAESSLQFLHYGYLSRYVQGGVDRLERSERLLLKAIAEEPQSPYLLGKLGFVYYESGRYDQAYETLKQVILELDCRRLEPSFVHQILSVLGDLALQRKEYEFADRCASAGLKLNTQAVLNRFCHRTQGLVILHQSGERLIAIKNAVDTAGGKIPQPRRVRYRKQLGELRNGVMEAERKFLEINHASQQEASVRSQVHQWLDECHRLQTEIEQLAQKIR